ncbi:tyrosine-type recombinase/integrase [Pseudomonadota bacterium]|nr:tyrosine-type recombinase/integrase [Pseudomonadota bacterium]
MATDNLFSFTNQKIEKLPIPAKDRVVYRDADNPKLICRVSSAGQKSFAVVVWKDNKTIRVTLGQFPVIPVTLARKMAMDILVRVACGEDINEDKRVKRAKSSLVTLSQVMDKYIEVHTLRPSTVKDYKYKINHDLANLAEKNIDTITELDIINVQKKLTKTSTSLSNAALRVLKLTLKYAFAIKLISENPADVITSARLMAKPKRKDRIIHAGKLGDWLKAVGLLENYKARVYLLLLLFTGLRTSEALNLTWDDIDLRNKTLKIYDTKNHLVHTLPIPDYLVTYLKELKMQKINNWVFGAKSRNGEDAPMTRPKKQVQIVVEATGVKFSPHDLRRTFATVSEAVGLPASMSKRLLNHGAKDNSDVTSGYIVSEEETIRKAINSIADFILERAEQKE